MGLWTFAIGLLFVAVMAWQVVRRGFQMRDLVQHGLPVTGTVVSKVAFRGKSRVRSHHLRYTSSAPDGHEYSHRIAISSAENEKYQEGDPIELMYLPNNPKVSATAQMVQMSRRALEPKS